MRLTGQQLVTADDSQPVNAILLSVGQQLIQRGQFRVGKSQDQRSGPAIAEMQLAVELGVQTIAGNTQLGFQRTRFVAVSAVHNAAVGLGATAPDIIRRFDDADLQLVPRHFPGNVQTDDTGADDAEIVNGRWIRRHGDKIPPFPRSKEMDLMERLSP